MKTAKPGSKNSALLDVIRQASSGTAARPHGAPSEEVLQAIASRPAPPAEPKGTAAAAAPAPVPPTVVPVALSEPRESGKASLMYLYDTDWKIIRELAAWLAGQGLRVNDSLVVRAALRVAQPGGAFRAACEQAQKSDRRLKSARRGK